MRLLLDTNALLWWLADDPSLHPQARAAIAAAETVYVSAASVWEIAIKQSRDVLVGADLDLDALVEDGFRPLAIEWEHARLAGALPPHHRDPFDRVLIAQATVERLTLVTRDRGFGRYAVPTIPA